MKIQPTEPKPIYPIHQKLKIVWWLWLAFRLFGVALLANQLTVNHRAILGGIVWQGLWLLPALLATPYIVKGKSPYALLLIIMLTFIYLGGSGMTVLKFGFGQAWGLMAVWLVDFGLLSAINVWLFILLKRLPKMNG